MFLLKELENILQNEDQILPFGLDFFSEDDPGCFDDQSVVPDFVQGIEIDIWRKKQEWR